MKETSADEHTGPFELTKLSAQLAGKMVRDTSGPRNPSAVNDLKTGTIRTAKQLIRDRGFKGLYSGYRLHLRTFTSFPFLSMHSLT